MVALRRDVNGSCYGVFPDCPLMDIPNSNTPIFYAYAILGQSIGHKLGLEVITPLHLALVALFALFVIPLIVKLLGFM